MSNRPGTLTRAPGSTFAPPSRPPGQFRGHVREQVRATFREELTLDRAHQIRQAFGRNSYTWWRLKSPRDLVANYQGGQPPHPDDPPVFPDCYHTRLRGRRRGAPWTHVQDYIRHLLNLEDAQRDVARQDELDATPRSDWPDVIAMWDRHREQLVQRLRDAGLLPRA